MKERLHNKVSEHRTALGITQEDLAQKVGVSRQTVISLEKGNYAPSVLLAIKIAGVFKVPVESLFKITYEK